MLPLSSEVPLGKRLSYGGVICTVRYVGKVEGQGDKTWLGVEWDNELRGKHNGTYKGKQYFTCLSPSPTAASLILSTSRKADPELSFLEAVKQKYASEVTLEQNPVSSTAQIEISGKVVQEVGFDKIRQQISKLDSLKIIILTNQTVNTASKVGEDDIVDVCPVVELIDLTGNLIHSFEEVVAICQNLTRLRTLKLNENRFMDLSAALVHNRNTSSDLSLEGQSKSYQQTLRNITDLEMQKVLLSWDDLVQTMTYFTSLKSFDGSRNHLSTITPSITSFKTLTTLVLDHNKFANLSSLTSLSQMHCLEVLRLKSNKIATICPAGENTKSISSFPTSLRYVDLSSNLVSDWEFVDVLPIIFPGLQELRFSGNPVYGTTSLTAGMSTAAEDSYMLTIAMLGTLTSLNFSKITAAERANAEMFYLSRIGKQMTGVPQDQEHTITSKHRRYSELCQIHGAPTIVRQEASDANPSFLEARLIKCTFYMPASSRPDQAGVVLVMKEIPKTFDIYRVKGLVGRLLGIQPLSLRLVWETGEWDPVAGYEDAGEVEDDEDEEMIGGQESGKMVSREVVLEDGTRPLGNWVDGMDATIRVEVITSKPSTYLDARLLG